MSDYKSDGSLPSVGEIIHFDTFMGTRFIVASRHEGGMGVVFRLTQINPILPDMALKLLAKGSDFAQAEREARIWISIGTGPFIAKASWGGMWRGRPAILSQWYARVASSLHPDHWLSHDFSEFSRSVVLGLKYAQEVGGIIHRDIKPSNILLDDHFRPYITDFGISLLASRPTDGVGSLHEVIFESKRTILTNNTAGTPPYMAPELFDGVDASVRTDIYSLGVTLYQLMTGEHPYAGPETKGKFCPRLRLAPLDSAIVRLPAHRKAIKNLILSCLALNPSVRSSDYDRLLTQMPQGDSIPNSGTISGDAPDNYTDIAAIVNLATTHRNQGKPDIAESILRKALVRLPDDPLLLTAWGVLAYKRRDLPDALKTWRHACRELEKSDGLYAGAVYLEPLANLSRCLVVNRDFEDAARWLRKGRNWSKVHSLPPTMFFPEFGWLNIFEGKIGEGLSILRQHLMKTQSDSEAANWLALGRVLGNYEEDLEIFICRTFEATLEWGPVNVIAAIVTAVSGTSGASAQLRRRAVSEFEKCNTTDGASFYRAIGLSDLTMKSLGPKLPYLIHILDSGITGGKNHEMVR